MTGFVSLSRMKTQVEAGEIPEVFLNTVTVVVDPEEAVWMLTPAVGLVERYTPDGNRLLSVILSEPEFEAARERFVVRNRTAEPNSSSTCVT